MGKRNINERAVKPSLGLCSNLIFALLFVFGCSGDDSGNTGASSSDNNSEVVDSPTQTTADKNNTFIPAEMERPTLEVIYYEDPIKALEHYLEHLQIAEGPPFVDPDYQPLKELTTESYFEEVEIPGWEVAIAKQEVFYEDPENQSSKLDISFYETQYEGFALLNLCWKDTRRTLKINTGQVVFDGSSYTYALFGLEWQDDRWRIYDVEGGYETSSGLDSSDEVFRGGNNLQKVEECKKHLG